MDEAVEVRSDEDAEDGVAVDEETAETGGKGCETDRFNPSLSALAEV